MTLFAPEHILNKIPKREKHYKIKCFWRKGSRPISRVLSWTIIHLRYALPHTSSDLPESSVGHTYRIPIWSCSERGLPSPQTVTSCAVRSYRTLSPLPPRRYLAFCPLEPGLSSPP